MRNNTSTKHVISERMSLLSQKDLSKPPEADESVRATDKNLCLNEFVHRSEKRTNLPGCDLSRSNAQCQVISMAGSGLLVCLLLAWGHAIPSDSILLNDLSALAKRASRWRV